MALGNTEGAQTRSGWVGRERGLRQANNWAVFKNTESRPKMTDVQDRPLNSIRETEDKAPK